MQLAALFHSHNRPVQSSRGDNKKRRTAAAPYKSQKSRLQKDRGTPSSSYSVIFEQPKNMDRNSSSSSRDASDSCQTFTEGNRGTFFFASSFFFVATSSLTLTMSSYSFKKGVFPLRAVRLWRRCCDVGIVLSNLLRHSYTHCVNICEQKKNSLLRDPIEKFWGMNEKALIRLLHVLIVHPRR